MYFLSISSSNEPNAERIEVCKDIRMGFIERQAYNLWAMLNDGYFQGYVVIETYEGNEIFISCDDGFYLPPLDKL